MDVFKKIEFLLGPQIAVDRPCHCALCECLSCQSPSWFAAAVAAAASGREVPNS